MITYNPKAWISFIFQFHKSDTIRKLFPMMCVIAALCWVIAYLELEYWKLAETSPIKNIAVMHSLLSFVISMLLVFRTNTAYERWWEGRKLWGTLVNTSRNLAIKLNSILPHDESGHRKFFKKLIPMYAAVLSDHLRTEQTRLALDEHEHHELRGLDRNKHVPNQVAALLWQRINRMYETGIIKGDHLIILNNELQTFTDVCGACERIKN